MFLKKMNDSFDFTIRNCTKKDYVFFRNLIKNSLYEYVSVYYTFDISILRKRFYDDYKNIKILMKGKRRIGLYQLKEEGTTLHVIKIFLTPAYQGKGIGTYYLKKFETLGYKKIILDVWDNNPARFLYKKLGYKKITIKNHKIRMEKIL